MTEDRECLMGGVWMGRGRSAQGQDAAEPQGEIAPTRWMRIWECRRRLLRVASYHGASTEEAEDIAQEAMLRAADHPEVADDRLQAWLVSVTIRLCMDGHRHRSKEARRGALASAHAEVEQPEQHLEEQACDRSEADWVASLATELLPPRQIQALRLTAEGCNVKQVASQLGVQYRAAESLLARARRTMRAALIGVLGVLIWVWRLPVRAVSNPLLAVASATAATVVAAVVVIVPPLVHSSERPESVVTPTKASTPGPTRPASATVPPTPGSVPILGPVGGVTSPVLPILPSLVPPALPPLGQAELTTSPSLPAIPGVQTLVPPAPHTLGQTVPIPPPALSTPPRVQSHDGPIPRLVPPRLP